MACDCSNSKDIASSNSQVQHGGVECDESYSSSILSKIRDCLQEPEVDLPSFANRIVKDAWSRFLHLGNMNSFDEKKTECSIQNQIYNMGFFALANLFFKGPKRLARHYKRCQSNLLKVREHELQVLLRLELLCCVKLEYMEINAVKQLIGELCELIDNIQFNLNGMFFERESFRAYCTRLIKDRYYDRLHYVVDTIFSELELNGYSDESAAKKRKKESGSSSARVSGGDSALASGSESARASGSGSGSENASVVPRKVVCPSKEGPRVEKFFYHFSSKAIGLSRVRTFKTPSKKDPKTSLRKKFDASSLPVAFVCETPILKGSQPSAQFTCKATSLPVAFVCETPMPKRNQRSSQFSCKCPSMPVAFVCETPKLRGNQLSSES